MSLSLNLLPSQAKFQAERNKIIALVKKTVIGFTGFWVALMLVVFGLWIYFTGQYAVVKGEYDVALSNYKPAQEKIVLGQQLKDELAVVKKILTARFEYGNAFKKMKLLFSDDVVVKNISLGREGNFTVSVIALNTSIMDKVQSRILEINSGKSPDFSRMKVTGLTWNSGTWNMGLDVKLKNAK
jgi:hypothetical protein